MPQVQRLSLMFISQVNSSTNHVTEKEYFLDTLHEPIVNMLWSRHEKLLKYLAQYICGGLGKDRSS